MTVLQEKNLLRQIVRQKVASMTSVERSAGALSIRQHLARLDAWKSARSLLLYAPLSDEVDIWPVVRDALLGGKEVALPGFDASSGCYRPVRVRDLEREIVAGRYGAREPKAGCEVQDPATLDFVLVPGVAFDTRGGRLGRGKGYYDRLLERVRGVTCGVGFDEQIVERIPREAHDVQLNLILTPTRILDSEQTLV